MIKQLFLTLLVFSSSLFAGDWENLFDGKTLTGWSVHSGFATYRVENGEIVGTTKPNSPNSFLCTDREYGDFILEFEVKLDNPELNSGVQFRSQIAVDGAVFVIRNANGERQTINLAKDRVYGYQVEIAANAASGGVYDEALRSFFLQDVSDNPTANKAFKKTEWNKYRIECRGNSIRTFINDIPCADFKDSLMTKGIIGLQVHGVGERGPYSVRWRNIRIQELD